MAQVTDDVSARVDWLIAHLLGECEDIPQLAAEWDVLDHDQRVDALIDWPVVELNLRTLEEYAGQGILSPAQQARYARLRTLVTTYRPVSRRLMAG